MSGPSRIRVATATTSKEMEMSREQKELVNACWEESQYDQGIAILEQLRSPKHRPCAQHIRQLVYLALHSSTPNLPKPTNVQASPTKPKREPFQISPQTANNARCLLTSYVLTNKPEGLLTAIPSCENNLSEIQDEDPSPLLKESHRIYQAQTCWDLLRPDFAKPIVASSLDKGKQSKRRAKEAEDEEDEEENLKLVGDDAWPVLEWLVSIFERQEANAAEGEPRISRLLLAQIPPNRNGLDARWDFNRPLDVTFFALQQDSYEKRRLGGRLVTMIINLSTTIYIDLEMLLTAFANRLITSSTSTVVDLMTLLPSTLPVLRFKIRLCQRLLNPDAPNAQRRSTARPRALAKTGSVMTFQPAPVQPAAPMTIVRKIAGPPLKDVLEAAYSQTTHNTLPVLRLRFELLSAYILVQNELPIEERDDDWKAAVGNGTFGKVVQNTFTERDVDGPVYSQMLQSLITVQ